MSKPDTSYLRTLLDSAKNVSILLPQKPDFDAVAAALGLKVSFDSSGKQTRVICADPMLVEFNRLVGVDTVIDNFGSRNLIISFPGQTEHVDKVSYNLDKGELQLVISPKPEAPELDHHKLKFVSGVSKTDLIVLMNISELTDLGSIYPQVKDHLSTTTIVSVSHQLPKENITLYQVHDPDASSLSEISTHLVNSLGLTLTEDAATNFLAGIEKATRNFQHISVSADTFEAAVILMRKGAKRQTEIQASDFPPGSIPSPPLEVTVNPTPPLQPAVKPIPTTPNSSQSGYGTDSTTVPASPNPPKKIKSETKPPSDWYEPKIFKGPMLP